MILSSTANVFGGPLLQFLGTPPTCSASKSSRPASSGRPAGGCAVATCDASISDSRQGSATNDRSMMRRMLLNIRRGR